MISGLEFILSDGKRFKCSEKRSDKNYWAWLQARSSCCAGMDCRGEPGSRKAS